MSGEGTSDGSQCWWRGCQKRGAVQELAGHRVILCETHARAITAALRSPERFEVRWGEWSGDTLTRKRRQLAEAKASLDAMGEAEEDEDPHGPRFELERHIEHLTRAEEELSEGPNRHPLVSIRDLSDSPPIPGSDYRSDPGLAEAERRGGSA